MSKDHQFDTLLREVHEQYRDLDEGQLADYIPELTKADPNWFGLAVVDTEGRVWEHGDAEVSFTIQSISKPFVFGFALQDHSREVVRSHVGAEPTGEPFHSVIQLQKESKRPYNPMVNTGAIAMAGLMQGETQAERIQRMVDGFSAYAGRTLAIDREVFQSEWETGDRNRAIAYFMKHFGMVRGRVDDMLDLYFRQCSVLANCRDLATMGATLAAGGVNPFTGERVLDKDYIQDLLTLMFTCGLYNYAGEWAYTVGLPGKSGVCGGLLAVVPRRMAIAVYSPLIDHHGNSVRGVKVCQEISRRLGLHVFGWRDS